MAASEEFVIWFDSLRRKDGEKVGGKNSSLGEMVQTLRAMASTSLTVSPRHPALSGASSMPMTCAISSPIRSVPGRMAMLVWPRPARPSARHS